MLDWDRLVKGLPQKKTEPLEASSDNLNNEEDILQRIDRNLGSIITPTNVEYIQESCPFIALRNGIVGFGFGGLLGLFMSGMGTSPYGPEEKVTVKSVLKEMGTKTWSSARNLGKIAVLYSATECAIEGYRAKHDLLNSAYAGCISGGILGAKGGPQSALLGCAGFAAFTIAIEAFMTRN